MGNFDDIRVSRVSKGTELSCGCYRKIGLSFLPIRCESRRAGRERGNAVRSVGLMLSMFFFRNVGDDDLSVLAGEFDVAVDDIGG